MKKGGSIFKKLFLAVAVFFTLIFGVLLAIPFLVDVDKYRPLILEKANENINGKLELGKLGLKVLANAKIEVDGFKLSDAQGTKLVQVKDAQFEIPLWSILFGSPRISLVLKKPEMLVVKQKDGKLNLLSLMKENTKSSANNTTNAEESKKSSKNTETTALPKSLILAKFSILIEDAKLTYKDELAGTSTKVDEFNFRLRDVSLGSEMPFEIKAVLNQKQPQLDIAGPVELKGFLRSKSGATSLDQFSVKALLNLNGLDITMSDSFVKKSGVPLQFDVQALVDAANVKLDSLLIVLGSSQIEVKGALKTAGNSTVLDLDASAKELKLSELASFSPMADAYKPEGNIDLKAQVSGTSEQLQYSAVIPFRKIKIKSDNMKQAIELEGKIELAPNQLKELLVVAKANAFDLKLKGNVQSFSSPRFKFTLDSKEMDLDGLLVSSEKAAEQRKEVAKNAKKSTTAEASTEAPVVDYNAMFEPLRKNPIVAASVGSFDFNLQKIRSTGVLVDKVSGQFLLDKGLVQLKDLVCSIFDGSIKGSMSINARSSKPVVGTQFQMSGLSTTKMLESSMPFAKNTIKGIISTQFNLGGDGLNTLDVHTNWKGNGSFEMKDAVINTLDLGKQIREGAMAKLPEAVRGKLKISDKVLDRQTEYQNLNVKFTMNPGTLVLSEINGKAYPQRGLDLKGDGEIKLASYALNLNTVFIDTYNLLNGQEIGKDEKYGYFTLYAKVGNTMFSPKLDWSVTVAKLAQNVAKNKGKEMLQKAGGGLLKNVLGGGSNSTSGQPSTQPSVPKPAEAIKSLKGLFGR